MAKVITYSRTFPKVHPRSGQSTFFVEKIWKWYYDYKDGDVRDLLWYNEQYDNQFGVDEIKNIHSYHPKWHTIRSGKRFKKGDKFSPRIWSGKPYASPQITIAPDITITETFDFEIKVLGGIISVFVDGWPFYQEDGDILTGEDDLRKLAENDGLTLDDFKAWFKWGTPFDGQIICWNKDVNY